MRPETNSLTAELEERLRFETLIADLSSKFVNLPAGEVDREIMDAQRRICELLGLDFSALWQWSDEAPGFFTLTHFYSAQEGPQPPERMNQDQYPWARQQLLAGRIIKVSSLEDLPAEAARDRETLRQFGIKSNLALPLSVGGEPPFGILGLNTTQAERDWPDALVKRLQLVAQIFANALARKRADQALRESEERLSLAADAAEAGLWVLDFEKRDFWATEKARMIFGYSTKEVITMDRLKASIHPDDWDHVQASVERSVHADEPVNVEYRIQLGDGRERWIASRGRPFFKPTGEPDRLLGSPWTSPSASGPKRRFAPAKRAWRRERSWPALGITKWTMTGAPASWTTGFGRSAAFPRAYQGLHPWSSGWNMCILTTANFSWTSVRSCTTGGSTGSPPSIATCIRPRGRSGSITSPGSPATAPPDTGSARSGWFAISPSKNGRNWKPRNCATT